MDPIALLLEFFNRYDRGSVVLPFGNHLFEVKTKFEPESVWLSEEDATGIPVCHGNLNAYGVQKTPTGFVIKADIESAWATVGWVAYRAA